MGAEWQSDRAGIKGLAIEYDDGCHQSVQLCVPWGVGYLAMSIMRFRDSASRISFFHSRPPPGLVTQAGIWDARGDDNGCCLRLVRSLQLECGKAESLASLRAREDAYGALIKDRIGQILDDVAQGAVAAIRDAR